MTKTKVFILLFFGLFLFFAIPSSHISVLAASSSGDVIVKEKTINVRKSASLSGSVIGYGKVNERYLIIGETKNWYKIQFKKTTGWVSKKVVKKTTLAKKGYLTDSVNYLYEDTTDTSAVAFEVPKNTAVSITKYAKGYYQLSYKNKKVYSKPGNITYQEPTISLKKFGFVTSTTLNVRKSGNASASIVSILKKEEVVQITGSKNGWYKIITNNKTGWVSGKYVSFKMPTIPSEPVGKLTIKNDATNLYDNPSIYASVTKVSNNGEQYNYYKSFGEWFAIKSEDGILYFVPRNHVTIYRPSNSEDGVLDPIESPLYEKIIVVDAGHGGSDTGAVGKGKLYEKKVNLLAALSLKDALEAKGATVIVTRDSDYYLTLGERVDISHYYNADLFISVHHDSATASATGFTTYYYHGRDKALATVINKGMNESLPLKNRGVKYGNYHVLRENYQPSLLLELGFMSNSSDVSIFNTDYYRLTFAESVTNGVITYFEE